MKEDQLNIPIDYRPGYERARRIDSRLADTYIAHTYIGDPAADALVEALTPLGGQELHRLITGAMNEDPLVFQEVPANFANSSTCSMIGRPGQRLQHLNPGYAAFIAIRT